MHIRDDDTPHNVPFLSGYFLLGLLSSLVFRAVRDALPDNAVAQERILGASFLALGIADVSPWSPPWLMHILISGLHSTPPDTLS